MPVEENKAIVTRFTNEALNGRRFDLFDVLIHPDYTLNEGMIHLAFTSFFALWCGVFAPRGIDFFTQQDMQPTAMRLFGCHPDDFAAGLVTLSQYALDKAGEARQLMQELNLP